MLSPTTGPTGGGATSPAAAPSPSAAARPVTGITAEPLSTAFRVQARDLRLVRLGPDELALQFEFANNTDRPLSPDTLGIDQIERIMMLVDLPRSTTYEMLTAQGLSGRLSENNGDEVPPGGAATVTAVFPAPPTETTALTVLVDGMLPVQVPVQPEGAPTLVDGGAGFGYLANPSTEYAPDGSHSVPAGATVTVYAFYAAPAPEVRTVDLEIGGFGDTVAAPVPG